MTKEQKDATIAALLHEKLGYERRALHADEHGDAAGAEAARARAAGVEDELRKLGALAKTSAKSAQTRPAGKAAAKR